MFERLREKMVEYDSAPYYGTRRYGSQFIDMVEFDHFLCFVLDDFSGHNG